MILALFGDLQHIMVYIMLLKKINQIKKKWKITSPMKSHIMVYIMLHAPKTCPKKTEESLQWNHQEPRSNHQWQGSVNVTFKQFKYLLEIVSPKALGDCANFGTWTASPEWSKKSMKWVLSPPSAQEHQQRQQRQRRHDGPPCSLRSSTVRGVRRAPRHSRSSEAPWRSTSLDHTQKESINKEVDK